MKGARIDKEGERRKSRVVDSLFQIIPAADLTAVAAYLIREGTHGVPTSVQVGLGVFSLSQLAWVVMSTHFRTTANAKPALNRDESFTRRGDLISELAMRLKVFGPDALLTYRRNEILILAAGDCITVVGVFDIGVANARSAHEEEGHGFTFHEAGDLNGHHLSTEVESLRLRILETMPTGSFSSVRGLIAWTDRASESALAPALLQPAISFGKLTDEAVAARKGSPALTGQDLEVLIEAVFGRRRPADLTLSDGELFDAALSPIDGLVESSGDSLLL